jgi:hypothetical protein
MKAQSTALLACLFPAAFLFTQLTAQTVAPPAKVSDSSKSASLNIPIQFEPNQGHAANDVRFLSRLPEGEVELTSDGFRLSLGQSEPVPFLNVKFVGMDPNGPAAGEDSGTGVANYYRGSDSAGWIRNVPLFAKVRYSNAYPSTDLIYRATRNHLEYDLELKPGADANNVSLAFTGADAIEIDKGGNLVINAGGRALRFPAPDSYQMENGKRIQVPSGYRILSRDRIGFSVGNYNHNETLVIDPVVAYADFLFLGDAQDIDSETALTGMTLDSSGDLFLITGTPVPSDGGGPISSNLVKIDASGNTVFQDLVPGVGNVLAIDPSGNVYMAGSVGPGFPTTGSNLGPCSSSGCGAQFVMKFDPTGNIVYSTTISANASATRISSLAVNANGNVFMAGTGAIEPVNAFQSGSTGGSGFFAELNTTGTGFVFASYLGEETNGQAIALDSAGNIYVAGSLGSHGEYNEGIIPLLRDFEAQADVESNGGLFLSKFTPDGQTLLFSTVLDGASVAGLAVGPDNTVYLAGAYTIGSDLVGAFPLTPGAAHYPLGQVVENPMFAMAINPSLTGLTYSEFLGTGRMNGMALDSQGDLFAIGTEIGDVTPSANALVSDIAASGFYLELDPTGKILTSSQFGGRAASQVPLFIALDPQGDIYLAGGVGANPGNAAPLGFPPPPDPITVGAAGFNLEAQLGGAGSYLYVAKILPANEPQISLSATPPLVVLRNVGTADLHLGAITSDQGPINVGGNCGTTVPAGTACMLVLSTNGSTQPVGTLTINSDAEPNVQTFQFVTGDIGPTVTNDLWIDDSKVVFGAEQDNVASAPESFTMWNMGITPLAVGPITAIAPSSVSSNCPAVLPAASSCVGQVVWKPGVDDYGSINVGYGTQSATSNFLTATFNPLGTLVASPTALLTVPAGTQSNGVIDFGTQTIGNPSLYRTVTVANVGASSMSVPSTNLSGDSEFSIAWNSCTTALPPQQSCALGVLYQPTAADTAQGTLTVSGGGGVSNITLSGAGRSMPLLTTVSVASSVDFGSVPLGNTTSQTVEITNTGTNTLTITNFSVDVSLGPYFSVLPGQCATVAVGSSCSFTIDFTAAQIGASTASLVLTDNTISSPQVVNITGTGLSPWLETYTSQLNFGNQDVNTSSGAQIAMLTNQGNETLNISDIAITDGFSQTNNCGAGIAAGASCNISVTFSPTQAITYPGSLTFSDSAPNSPQTTFSLSGSGIVPVPGVTLQAASGSSNYSAVIAGTTATYTLTALSSGGFSGTVVLACTGAPTYATCSIAPNSISLKSGSSANLNVSVTTETTSQVPAAGRSNIGAASLGFVCLPALSLLTLAWGRRWRPSSWLSIIVLGFLLAVVSSCGGGGNGGGSGGGGGGTTTVVNKTVPGTYTLTVTATVGNIVSNTETLTLVVQ